MSKAVFLDDDLWPKFRMICVIRNIPLREFLNQCIREATGDDDEGSTFADNIAQAWATRKTEERKALVERVQQEYLKKRALGQS